MLAPIVVHSQGRSSLSKPFPRADARQALCMVLGITKVRVPVLKNLIFSSEPDMYTVTVTRQSQRRHKWNPCVEAHSKESLILIWVGRVGGM